MNDHYTLKEAASELEVGMSTVRRLIKRHTLRGSRMRLYPMGPKSWVVPKEDIEKLVSDPTPRHIRGGRYSSVESIIPLENRLAVAWTIAAEGTISISSLRKGSRVKNLPSPKLRVGNTEKRFILEFHKLVDGAGGVYEGHKDRPRRKDDYFWQLRSVPGVYKFLSEILDFLPIKREVALVVIEFCKVRMRHYHKSWGEEELTLIKKVRVLNKRGPKDDGTENKREVEDLSAAI